MGCIFCLLSFGYPLFVLKSLEHIPMAVLVNLNYSIDQVFKHYNQVLRTKHDNLRVRDYNEIAFLPHNKYFGISNNNNRGI